MVWKHEGVGECLDTGSFMGSLWLAEWKSGLFPHHVLLHSACAVSRREHRQCHSSGGCSVAWCEVRMQERGWRTTNMSWKTQMEAHLTVEWSDPVIWGSKCNCIFLGRFYLLVPNKWGFGRSLILSLSLIVLVWYVKHSKKGTLLTVIFFLFLYIQGIVYCNLVWRQFH